MQTRLGNAHGACAKPKRGLAKLEQEIIELASDAEMYRRAIAESPPTHALSVQKSRVKLPQRAGTCYPPNFLEEGLRERVSREDTLLPPEGRPLAASGEDF